MGVMCSLLGHDYGDTDVEREREEQGDEVVRTAKRVERCRNCDHARTISENTEVTALSAAAGVVREPDGTVVAATDELTETVSETDESEQPVSLRTTADGPSAGSARPSSGERNESDSSIAIESVVNAESALIPDGDENDGTSASERTTDENTETVGIDRVHNDNESRSRPRRAPGEWPTESTNTVSETTRQESAGLGSSGSLADGGSHVSRWPGETDAAETRTAPANRRNAAGNGTAPTADFRESNRTVAGGSFACASCGFSAAVADSPLRAGDICPDCGRGYLAWETRKG